MKIEYVLSVNSVGMVLCAVPVVNGLVRVPRGCEVVKDKNGQFIIRRRGVKA